MKKYLKYVMLVIIAGIASLLIYTYVGFNRKGLDTWLVGQTEGERYPDWKGTVAVQEVGLDSLNRKHLFFSKVFLLKGTDSYQLRFRIAYSIPFLRSSLLADTDWVKVADADGNDYTGCLTVYPSAIAGLNCLNVTLVMEEDTFSALSGGRLTVSAVCAEEGLNAADSYAGFDAEILVPELP